MTPNIVIQYIIVAVIIAALIWVWVRSRRKPDQNCDDGCCDCPIAKSCKRKANK